MRASSRPSSQSSLGTNPGRRLTTTFKYNGSGLPGYPCETTSPEGLPGIHPLSSRDRDLALAVVEAESGGADWRGAICPVGDRVPSTIRNTYPSLVPTTIDPSEAMAVEAKIGSRIEQDMASSFPTTAGELRRLPHSFRIRSGSEPFQTTEFVYRSSAKRAGTG